jgi:hypothetical protein
MGVFLVSLIHAPTFLFTPLPFSSHPYLSLKTFTSLHTLTFLFTPLPFFSHPYLSVRSVSHTLSHLCVLALPCLISYRSAIEISFGFIGFRAHYSNSLYDFRIGNPNRTQSFLRSTITIQSCFHTHLHISIQSLICSMLAQIPELKDCPVRVSACLCF